MLEKKKKTKYGNRKGFTLLEAIVSLFVFSILVTAVSGVFVEFIDAQKYSKDLQTRLESLQMQSNLIAKTARTSKLTYAGDNAGNNNTGPASVVNVIFYDYSRTAIGESGCLSFKIDNGILKFGIVNVAAESECIYSKFSTVTYVNLSDASFKVAGQFYFKHGGSSSAGLFVSSLIACDLNSSTCDATTAKAVRVQASASMKRDK